MARKSNTKLAVVPQELRIDLCCGKNKKPGFLGVDQFPMDGVDLVIDVRKRWPWENDSVSEVHCSHALEHFTGLERVHFMNELYRVLKPGAKATIITPHWASNRAYGDFTHQWPPVSEMFFYYLSRDWRKDNAPHTDKKWNPDGFDCSFIATWGYGMSPAILSRNAEYQQYALANYKEAAMDTHATLEKQ